MKDCQHGLGEGVQRAAAMAVAPDDLEVRYARAQWSLDTPVRQS